MGLTPEQLGAGFVGLVICLGAIGQYLRSLKEKPKHADPVLAGVGLELGNREQTERLIAQVTRIADALTDKNTEAVQDRLEDLAEKVDAALKSRPRR